MFREQQCQEHQSDHHGNVVLVPGGENGHDGTNHVFRQGCFGSGRPQLSETTKCTLHAVSVVLDPKEGQASRAAVRSTSASAAGPSRSQEVVEIREHEAGVSPFLSSSQVGSSVNAFSEPFQGKQQVLSGARERAAILRQSWIVQ